MSVAQDPAWPTGAPSIDADELLLRRVPPQFFPDPDRPGRPQWIAFRPTKDDADGLSLNRRRFVASIEDFSYNAARDKRRSVAQLRADQVTSLGLHVEPRPRPGDMGHAVIPELTFPRYESGGQARTAIKEWAAQLAAACEMVLVLPAIPGPPGGATL